MEEMTTEGVLEAIRDDRELREEMLDLLDGIPVAISGDHALRTRATVALRRLVEAQGE